MHVYRNGTEVCHYSVFVCFHFNFMITSIDKTKTITNIIQWKKNKADFKNKKIDQKIQQMSILQKKIDFTLV